MTQQPKTQKDSNSDFEQQMQHIQCIGGPYGPYLNACLIIDPSYFHVVHMHITNINNLMSEAII